MRYCNCNVYLFEYCYFHANSGTVDPHRNRKRALFSQSTVRDEFVEKKYQVKLCSSRPPTYSSPNAPLTTQQTWRSVQVSSGHAFRLEIIRSRINSSSRA
ncbi:unnamed protein product [Ascophyllum nodosum]